MKTKKHIRINDYRKKLTKKKTSVEVIQRGGFTLNHQITSDKNRSEIIKEKETTKSIILCLKKISEKINDVTNIQNNENNEIIKDIKSYIENIKSYTQIFSIEKLHFKYLNFNSFIASMFPNIMIIDPRKLSFNAIELLDFIFIIKSEEINSNDDISLNKIKALKFGNEVTNKEMEEYISHIVDFNKGEEISFFQINDFDASKSWCKLIDSILSGIYESYKKYERYEKYRDEDFLKNTIKEQLNKQFKYIKQIKISEFIKNQFDDNITVETIDGSFNQIIPLLDEKDEKNKDKIYKCKFHIDYLKKHCINSNKLTKEDDYKKHLTYDILFNTHILPIVIESLNEILIKIYAEQKEFKNVKPYMEKKKKINPTKDPLFNMFIRDLKNTVLYDNNYPNKDNIIKTLIDKISNDVYDKNLLEILRINLVDQLPIKKNYIADRTKFFSNKKINDESYLSFLSTVSHNDIYILLDVYSFDVNSLHVELSDEDKILIKKAKDVKTEYKLLWDREVKNYREVKNLVKIFQITTNAHSCNDIRKNTKLNDFIYYYQRDDIFKEIEQIENITKNIKMKIGCESINNSNKLNSDTNNQSGGFSDDKFKPQCNSISYIIDNSNNSNNYSVKDEKLPFLSDEKLLGYSNNCYNSTGESIINESLNMYPCFLGNKKTTTFLEEIKSDEEKNDSLYLNKFKDPFLTLYGIEMSIQEVIKVNTDKYNVNFKSDFVVVSALRRTWATAIILYSYYSINDSKNNKLNLVIYPFLCENQDIQDIVMKRGNYPINFNNENMNAFCSFLNFVRKYIEKRKIDKFIDNFNKIVDTINLSIYYKEKEIEIVTFNFDTNSECYTHNLNENIIINKETKNIVSLMNMNTGSKENNEFNKQFKKSGNIDKFIIFYQNQTFKLCYLNQDVYNKRVYVVAHDDILYSYHKNLNIDKKKDNKLDLNYSKHYSFYSTLNINKKYYNKYIELTENNNKVNINKKQFINDLITLINDNSSKFSDFDFILNYFSLIFNVEPKSIKKNNCQEIDTKMFFKVFNINKIKLLKLDSNNFDYADKNLNIKLNLNKLIRLIKE